MIDPTSDNRLMEDVREGKVEKLAILFERHHMALYNFFLRLTQNRNLSEDLVQDVFFRILKYRTTYQGEGKFAIWMYQIARNAHIDHLRKHRETFPLEDQWEEAQSEERSPSEKTERAQEIALLNRALAKLSPTKKEVLILSRFQNMKYKEIAELLRCQVGTVKTQVHRAIRELGNIYSELSGGITP